MERGGREILIVYCSMYVHIHRLAQAVAEGVRGVPVAEAVLRRVYETLTEDVPVETGTAKAQKG